jgi:phospholipase/carboxylesterase
MHEELIIFGGNQINAKKALIMLHGRGGTAEDILTLSKVLHVDDYLLAAPQATNNSWYPKSFLAPAEQNEPWLSSALDLLNKLVSIIEHKGIDKENIYFVGFSQGACLMIEYVTRNATRYGGAAAFTGGLIGNRIQMENYSGNFENSPIFIGTSDPDFHVPVERVYATANVMRNMGADVTEKIYANMGHMINSGEIEQANQLIFK